MMPAGCPTMVACARAQAGELALVALTGRSTRWLLRHHQHLLVHRRAPFRMLSGGPPDDLHIVAEDVLRDGPGLAIAYGETVHAEDGCDLVAAAAEEGLVGHVDLGAIDLLLLHGDPHLLPEQLHERHASDALQDIRRGGWGDHFAPAHHEKRGAGALGDMPLG